MPDDIDITDVKINLEKDYGFTQPGADHYKYTVNDFANLLLQRADIIGQGARASNSPLEITRETVTTAAHYVFGNHPKSARPRWLLPARIAEFVCAAIVGAGSSNLNTNWGILAFGFGLAVATLLFVFQLVKAKED